MPQKKYNLQQIKEFRKINNDLIEEINGNQNWGFDEPWEYFILGMSYLTPQSYGGRIQNRLIRHFNLKKNKANEDSGDFESHLESYEFKTSLLTSTNNSLNLVQIRPWQDVSYYCIAFDIRNVDNFKCYVFKLSKSEMKRELATLKATAAHGTKTSLENNKNIELRMSIKFDDKSFSDPESHVNRWIKDYDFTHRFNLTKVIIDESEKIKNKMII